MAIELLENNTKCTIKSTLSEDKLVTLYYTSGSKILTKSVLIEKGMRITKVDVPFAAVKSTIAMTKFSIEKVSGGQIAAGNYKKERIWFQGIHITIENKKGSFRSGTDPEGKKWSNKMTADYGYIKNTVGMDGEQIDCFVGPNKNAANAYVVTIMTPPKFTKADEQKICFGLNSKEEAIKLIKSNYDDPRFFGSVLTMPMTTLKDKLKEAKENPTMLKALLAAYIIEKAKKPLRQGEHRSPPSGYPTDPSEYADPIHFMFPLNNEERVRAAITYFPKHKWDAAEHKKEAAKRILAAAKKYKINVSKESTVNESAH